MEATQQNSAEEVAESSISLGDIFGAILKHIWVIIAVMIVAIGGGVGFTLMQTPQHKSSGTMMVDYTKANNESSTTQYMFSEYISNTFVVFIKENVVLKEVADETGYTVAQLKNNLSVSNNELILSLSYTDEDPVKAQEVLDCVMRKAIEVANAKTTEGEVMYKVLNNNLKTLSEATTATKISKTVQNMLIAVAAGVALSAAYVILREMLDNRFRTGEQVERTLGIPVIANIPYYTFDDDKKAKAKK